MKKLGVLILVAIILVTAGCTLEVDEAFATVDQSTREDLLSFLTSAALGGAGEYSLTVQEGIGSEMVGEVSGTVSGSLDGAQVVSFSFFEDTMVEAGRTPVQDGKWGPVTVLYGPKLLALMNGRKVSGYWLTPQSFAMTPLIASRYKNLLVSPRESGLVALALAHSRKYQEAANLLAAIRSVHLENQGLPLKADVFGRAQGEGIDAGSTAWVGYAAAVLAGLTRNSDLWEEARTYALYLRDLDVPADVDSRLAGWLLFDRVAERYPEFGYLPAKWQPEVNKGYDPRVGTWMLVSGQDIIEYVDLSYLPESPVDKWIHYNLLAAVNQLPDELGLELTELPSGKAVMVEEQVSLEATSWMILALTGKVR